MNCRFLDAQGKSQPAVMGCYGIGVTRMAAAWIEQNHDDKGIIWSPQIAPFDAHLIGLNLEDASVSAEAENVYQRLQAGGFEVLFDDRPARAGEKFSDADLIGIPARVTISKRALEQKKLEFKWRAESQAQLLSLEEVETRINAGRKGK
jgi:prolyl-tRNA synthetase